MAEKVYLIGEHHIDFNRPERYARVFAQFNPEIISLESEGTDCHSSEDALAKFLYFALKRGAKHEVLLRDVPRCFAGMSFVEGAHVAALFYQRLKEEEGKKVKIMHSDSTTRLLHYDAEKHKNFAADTFKELAMYWMIISTNALGMERLNKISSSLSLPLASHHAEIQDESVWDLLLSGSSEELSKTQEWYDCLYLLAPEFQSPQFVEAFDGEARDDFAVDRIAQMSGVVAHLGGLSHIFGNYDNLYEKLRIKGIPVERFKLIDFSHASTQEHQKYIKRLEEMCAEIKTEAEEVLSAMTTP